MILKLKSILYLLRVKQWVKNGFIFFPLLFSGHFLQLESLRDVFLTFIAFSFISSSVYVFNDSLDRGRDIYHPKKAKRYQAYKYFPSSLISFIVFVLLVAGLSIAYQISWDVFFVLIVYIGVNILYNLVVKNLVILDVIFIAVGFYLRIWAGAFAASVMPSMWLQMCVFILALFLGFSKRRYEMTFLKERAHDHRKVLVHYTSYLLDQIIIICSTLAIVFYGMYTISSDIVNRIGTHHMIYSVVFVIYGMFRYLYLIHVKHLGDDPGELLLSDRPLLICVLLWIGFVAFLLYLPQFI